MPDATSDSQRLEDLLIRLFDKPELLSRFLREAVGPEVHQDIPLDALIGIRPLVHEAARALERHGVLASEAFARRLLLERRNHGAMICDVLRPRLPDIDAFAAQVLASPAAIHRAMSRESGLLATAKLELEINSALGEVYARLRARFDVGPLVKILRGARVIARVSDHSSSQVVNLLDERIGSALGGAIGAWIEELASTREGQRGRVIIGDDQAYFPSFQALLDALEGGEPSTAILRAVERAIHQILDADRWLFGRLQREFSRRWNDEIVRELWPERNRDGNDLPRLLDPLLAELAHTLDDAIAVNLDLRAIVERACGASVRQWTVQLASAGAALADRERSAREAAQHVDALQQQVAQITSQVGAIDRQLNQALGLTFLALVGLGLSLVAGLWSYHVLAGRIETEAETRRAALEVLQTSYDHLDCQTALLSCLTLASTPEAGAQCAQAHPACAVP